ncbi:MAG: hypothetical protein AABX88_00970 [Nanoarchaeota archaeon]
MLQSVILASYTYFESGAIGDVLQMWERAGFFSYLLPILLIFTLINAILSQLKIFGESKGTNAIISLVISFMALQFPIVSQLFTEIFPRLAMGIVILLVVLILVGMFMPNAAWMKVTLFGVAVVVLIVVLVNTSDALGSSMSQTISDNFGTFLGGLVLIILFAVAANAGTPSTNEETKLFNNIFGGGHR